MGRIEGAKDFTELERELLLSLVSDYMMFRVKPHEILQLIEKRTGRKISMRTLIYLRKEINRRQGTSNEWLEDFAMGKMADFYRNRIEEVEYIQKQLLLIFEEEANKTEKKNKYLMDKLAKTIGENSKILAEFGMAPPIISKIKQLLPVDINEMNSRFDKHTKEVKSLINDIDNSKIIDGSLHEGQTPDSAENETFDAEFEQLVTNRTAPKSGYVLDTDKQATGRADQGDRSTESDEEQYIF